MSKRGKYVGGFRFNGGREPGYRRLDDYSVGGYGYMGGWRQPQAQHEKFVAKASPRAARIPGSGTRWPGVQLSPMAAGKMSSLIQVCQTEVSWLCSASLMAPTNDVMIEDVFVPEQSVSPGYTQISPDGEARMLMELMASGERDVIKKLRVWGHSHVSMAVFASSQDETETNTFLGKHGQMNSEFFIRLIGNKHGELYATLYFLHKKLYIDDAVVFCEKCDRTWDGWAAAELKSKTTEHTWMTERGFRIEAARDFTPERRSAAGEDAMLRQWRKSGQITDEMYETIMERRRRLLAASGPPVIEADTAALPAPGPEMGARS